MTFADLVTVLCPLGQRSRMTRLYNFFATISCEDMSIERKIGHCLSLLFSSRSWRNSRNSLPPKPAYFFFHKVSSLTDPHPAAELGNFGPAFAVLQSGRNLLVSVRFSRHLSRSPQLDLRTKS